MGPMQMFTLRVRLVGRANTLENVGRNVWLYTKKKIYNTLLTPIQHVL